MSALAICHQLTLCEAEGLSVTGQSVVYSQQIMTLGAKIRISDNRVRILSVALLVILLLFTSVVQVTHVHADGEMHADCGLCQTAHNTVRAPVVPCIQTVFLVLIRITPPLKREYREHVFSFSHWDRPPPDQPAIA
jgi:hypothetical protein